MNFVRTKAIILRRTNYGEADRIVNFLTPQQGRIAAIAKGVRRPKSKLAGGLELFAECDVTLAQGRGELLVVTGARLETFYRGILQDYDRLQFGYQAVKQIAQVTESVSGPEFYFLLQNCLLALNQQTIDWRLTALWFGLTFKHLLGEGVNLHTDRNGHLLIESNKYGFSSVEGVFYLDPNGSFTGDHIKFLRLALKTSPIVLSKVATSIKPQEFAVFIN